MNDDTGVALEPEPGAVGEAAKTGRFFDRTDWLGFWLTTALILAVYLFTLCPSVELDFGGIFDTAAMYGGVAQPPGFPLWTNYAHLFTLMPFSNIAWRVSVASAVAAATACGLIALIVSRLGALTMGNLHGLPPLSGKAEKWVRVISGCVAGMSFGLSESVWSYAVRGYWWSLTFALLGWLICLLMRWCHTPERNRYLYGAMLVYGLAFTNSQTLIAAAPALELFVLIVNPGLGRDLFAVTCLLLTHVVFSQRGSLTPNERHYYIALAGITFLIVAFFAIWTRKVFTKLITVLACFAFVALGLTAYFYSPIASMTDPPMNWAYPRTVDGFFHLIARGQYEAGYPAQDLGRYWQEICLYCGMLTSDYGWGYLVPAVIPLMFVHRMRSAERKFVLSLIGLFLFESFFLLALLNPSSDAASRDLHQIHFAPSYLILSLLTGCGLALIAVTTARRREQAHEKGGIELD
jgi:Protein of unknown function (DUF2723)